jgi:hypothetical protein
MAATTNFVARSCAMATYVYSCARAARAIAVSMHTMHQSLSTSLLHFVSRHASSSRSDGTTSRIPVWQHRRASSIIRKYGLQTYLTKVKTDVGTGGRGPVFTDGGSSKDSAHLTAEHRQQLNAYERWLVLHTLYNTIRVTGAYCRTLCATTRL